MTAGEGKPGLLRRAADAWIRLEDSFENSLMPWIVATALLALVTLVYVVASWLGGDGVVAEMPDAPR